MLSFLFKIKKGAAGGMFHPLCNVEQRVKTDVYLLCQHIFTLLDVACLQLVLMQLPEYN